MKEKNGCMSKTILKFLQCPSINSISSLVLCLREAHVRLHFEEQALAFLLYIPMSSVSCTAFVVVVVVR